MSAPDEGGPITDDTTSRLLIDGQHPDSDSAASSSAPAEGAPVGAAPGAGTLCPPRSSPRSSARSSCCDCRDDKREWWGGFIPLTCPPNWSKSTRHLFTLDHVAVPIFYFILGLNLTLVQTPLLTYMRERLKASPANQALIKGVLMHLPWNFKIFYAFLSDCVPIMGMRRKPYMVVGVICFTTSWIILGITNPATVGAAATLLFFATFGLIFSDVMADTFIVEWVQRYEKGWGEEEKGGLQSRVWALRFAGNIIGSLAGGWLAGKAPFAHLNPRYIFIIQGCVHLVLVVPLVFLKDKIVDDLDRDSAATKAWQLWDMLQDRRVWGAIIFIYISAVTPNSGDGTCLCGVWCVVCGVYEREGERQRARAYFDVVWLWMVNLRKQRGRGARNRSRIGEQDSGHESRCASEDGQ